MNIELHEDLYFREKYLNKIRGFYHETEIIKVITGVRRCGKSSLMQMVMKELLDSGIKEDNIVNIGIEKNPKYKELLLAEYRYIKSIQEKIRKNAKTIYNIKIKDSSSGLSKRCNDFLLLEKLYLDYNNTEDIPL